MRTLIALVIIAAAQMLRPTPAACTFCYPGKCFSSNMCGAKCLCLKKGLDVSGYCYSTTP